LVFEFKRRARAARSFLHEPVFRVKALKEIIMTGKVLSQAAEIIVTAGAQIEAMLEKTNSQMFQMMEDRGELVSEYYDYKYDRNGWIITDYIHGYELKKGGKGKRKAHGHVGVHLAFYNEQYCGNSGWEPSLFVFYAPGCSPCGSFLLILKTIFRLKLSIPLEPSLPTRVIQRLH
jgi:hypothetical protein